MVFALSPRKTFEIDSKSSGVYSTEKWLKKRYHPNENPFVNKVELIMAVRKYSPKLKVLYAYYSNGRLVDYIKRELNVLESQIFLTRLFNKN